MKSAWSVLLISALTDGVIASATALIAAMGTASQVQMPTWPILAIAGLGGLLAFSRTVQQGLRADAEITAAHSGKAKPTLK